MEFVLMYKSIIIHKVLSVKHFLKTFAESAGDRHPHGALCLRRPCTQVATPGKTRRSGVCGRRRKHTASQRFRIAAGSASAGCHNGTRNIKKVWGRTFQRGKLAARCGWNCMLPDTGQPGLRKRRNTYTEHGKPGYMMLKRIHGIRSGSARAMAYHDTIIRAETTNRC